MAPCRARVRAGARRNTLHAQSQIFTRVHGYQNARLDELAEQQLTATEPDERRRIVNGMQVILAQDVPMLSLYYPEDLWIYRTGHGGGLVLCLRVVWRRDEQRLQAALRHRTKHGDRD